MVDWSLRIINTYHIYLGWLMVDGWLATLVAESHLRLGSPQPRGQLRLVLEEFLAQGWEAWREPSDTSAEDTVFQDVKSLSKLMDDDIYDHVCISIWWIYIYIHYVSNTCIYDHTEYAHVLWSYMHPAETPKPEARRALDLGTHGRDRERLTWGTFSVDAGASAGDPWISCGDFVALNGILWHVRGFKWGI